MAKAPSENTLQVWSNELLIRCRDFGREEALRLPFQKPLIPQLANGELLLQYEAYRKAQKKLPHFYKEGQILFPDLTAVEQSSSEWTARYKRKIAPHFDLLIDASAGLGVDAWYLSNGQIETWAYEPNETRAAVLNRNFSALGHIHFKVINSPFQPFQLPFIPPEFSQPLLFVDPDRRPNADSRAVNFQNYEPDLKACWQWCAEKKWPLLAKLSPMEDVKNLLKLLPDATSVHTVSVHMEVKEVLVLWDFSRPWKKTKFWAVEIRHEGVFREIALPDEDSLSSNFTDEEKVIKFILDPWPAIRKDFQDSALMKQLGFAPLATGTQLYVAAKLPDAFPGRVFEVKDEIESINSFISKSKNLKINTILRNFPETAERFSQKAGWHSGGNLFFIGIVNSEHKKQAWVCEKVEIPMPKILWISLLENEQV